MKAFYLVLVITAALFYSCTEDITNQFRNNEFNTAVYSSEPITENPTLKWKFKTEGRVHASAAYDGTTVYMGSEDGNFYALDASTGELIWKYKTDAAIFSSAAIEGNYIYFNSYDGNLYKLKRQNGELVWKFASDGEQRHIIKDYYDNSKLVTDFWDFFQSSPVVKGNFIYFGIGNSIYAVKKENGVKKWKYKTEGSVHSSPAISGNKLVVGSMDSRVYCLNIENGEEFWTYETGRDTAQLVWIGVQASPMIDNDSVYFGSRDASIYCLNLHNGDTIWTNDNFERSWMPSSFALGTTSIYAGSSDRFSFYEIEKATGKILNIIKTNSYTFSSPAITGNMAYIGSVNGRLYGINLDDKKVSWEFITQGAKTDTLKIYNEAGEMDSEQFRLKYLQHKVDNYEKNVAFFKMKLQSAGAIVSSPVIHHGTIYFGSCDGYIYAISK